MVLSKEDIGKVADEELFMKDISKAYQSEKYTDISFVLSDGVTVETNRFILAWRSDYFASMLFGGLKEGNSDQVVLQCSSPIFRLILDYIWEGRVDFSHLDLQPLLDLMENARMMCLDRLARSIEDYLKHLLDSNKLDIGETLFLLEFCVANKFEELEDLVLWFVDLKLVKVARHDEFSTMSTAAILSILKYERTSPEIVMFNALASWMRSQVPPLAVSAKMEMLNHVDLLSISSSNLMKFVRNSGLYEDKAICDALEEQVGMENVNMCLEEKGAKLKEGIAKMEGSCIRGPPHKYADQTGYTFAELGESITIQMKRECMINKVEFLLWDQDDRTYSYILSSSMDGVNWSTLMDCTEMACSSKQTIFFHAKPIRFFSVIGTSNSHDEDDPESKNFHIVSFFATFDTTDSEKKNTGMLEM